MVVKHKIQERSQRGKYGREFAVSIISPSELSFYNIRKVLKTRRKKTDLPKWCRKTGIARIIVSVKIGDFLLMSTRFLQVFRFIPCMSNTEPELLLELQQMKKEK